MALLSLLKNYEDDKALFEGNLDDIRVGAQDFFNITKINDGNLQAGGITGSDKLADDSITGDKIASAVAGTGLSQDGSGNLQIADGGVAQAKLESKTVTTDGSDPGAGGVSISTETDSNAVSSSTPTDLSGFSVTLTTTGRPVMVTLLGSAADLATGGFVRITKGSGSGRAAIRLVRDSTDVSSFRFDQEYSMDSFGDQSVNTFNLFYPSSHVLFLDTPSAGTYTYKLQGALFSGTELQIFNSRLIAREI